MDNNYNVERLDRMEKKVDNIETELKNTNVLLTELVANQKGRADVVDLQLNSLATQQAVFDKRITEHGKELDNLRLYVPKVDRIEKVQYVIISTIVLWVLNQVLNLI